VAIVIVTFVPIGISVIEEEVIIPAEEEIIELFGLIKFIL
jgi:hypothetical protein